MLNDAIFDNDTLWMFLIYDQTFVNITRIGVIPMEPSQSWFKMFLPNFILYIKPKVHLLTFNIIDVIDLVVFVK